MKILLTGATGFVGSHTARLLRENGHDVLALVRKSSKHRDLQNIGVKLVFGDLSDSDAPLPHIPQVDSVLHVAGIIKARNAREFHAVNAAGTARLIDALAGQKDLKRFVLVSSIAARGPNASMSDTTGKGPVSQYGHSKLAGEEIARARIPAQNLVILRPPIVYGPGDTETLTLFKMFKAGFFTMVGSQESRMSFVFVGDLARILMHAAATCSRHPGPYYPEDGSGGYAWQDVLDVAAELFGKKIRTLRLPIWTAGVVATASEFGGKALGKMPMLTREKFKEIREPLWACPDKECHKVFRLNDPVTIKRGFSLAKEWYERQGWL